MKFGSNLSQLSIPEWRNYNLDYNLLKKTIKQVTDADETNLSALNHVFIENFNYINLFIKVKFDELFAKLKYLQNGFDQISSDSENYLYKLDVVNYQIYQVSLEINKLSKFIIIQKIATRKIFKKFNKHYFNKHESTKFIINLKNYLLTNENSFINLDLFQLTSFATNLISNINHARRSYISSHRHYSQSSVISHKSSNSLFPKSFTPSSLKQQDLHPQQSPPNSDCNFDLLVLLKKNFHLYFLSPTDMINDLMLYLNMDLQPKNQHCQNVFTSHIYLFDETDIKPEPSYIVSQSDQSFSIIISFIGGLRKYSYCILPNDIVQLLLNYLYDREDPSLKSQLYDYFVKSNISSLTRTTIDTILQRKLLPKLKLVSNRSRYILDGNSKIDTNDQNRKNCDGEEDDLMTTYNDDYMVTLDCNICTTNNPKLVNSLEFTNLEMYEKFPHNRIFVSTNDFNLSNFESSLESVIDNEYVSNTFNHYYFRQLPIKLQHFINKCNNVTLMKSLNFYQYMLSCYFNRIDKEFVNNHYTNLLNLNLLKSLENVDNFNHQLEHEHRIIQNKADELVRRQLSVNHQSNAKNSSIISVASTPSIFDKHPSPENPYHNHYHSGSEEEVFMDLTTMTDDYSVYLNFQHHPSMFGNFINSIIKLKHRFSKSPYLSPINYYTKPKSYLNKPIYGAVSEEPNMINYDSIYDEEPHFLQRNELEDQYENSYDLTISYIYFTLSIVATFLSGIDLGILYSFSRLSDNVSKFLITDNPWLLIAVIFGLLLAFILSLVSINISFNRFSQPPIYHSIIIWTGFLIVVSSCVCGAIIIL